jgi:hypothetical protein
MKNASSCKDLCIPALGRFRMDYDILWEGRVSLPGVGKVYVTLVSPPGKQPSAYTIKTLELFLRKWNAATYRPMIYDFFWQEWLKNKEPFLGRRERLRRIPRIQNVEELRRVVRVCGPTAPIKERCHEDQKRFLAGTWLLK